MKIAIGLQDGARVRYRHRKDLIGSIIQMKGNAVWVEWDHAPYPIAKRMWVNQRSLKKIGIIRGMVEDYRGKVKDLIIKAKSVLP